MIVVRILTGNLSANSGNPLAPIMPSKLAGRSSEGHIEVRYEREDQP